MDQALRGPHGQDRRPGRDRNRDRDRARRPPQALRDALDRRHPAADAACAGADPDTARMTDERALARMSQAACLIMPDKASYEDMLL
jgi:hypothetical protein